MISEQEIEKIISNIIKVGFILKDNSPHDGIKGGLYRMFDFDHQNNNMRYEIIIDSSHHISYFKYEKNVKGSIFYKNYFNDIDLINFYKLFHEEFIYILRKNKLMKFLKM